MEAFKTICATAMLFSILACPLGCESAPQTPKQAEVTSQPEAAAVEQKPAEVLVQPEAGPSVDYASVFNTINVLQREVLVKPSDVKARQALVKAAVDQHRRKLYVVGEGAPNAEQAGASETLLLQGAERAAVVDAQRWALLVLAWAQDANKPAPNSQVSGTVPPHAVVYKAQLPDRTMQVLIEVTL
jgi:hypothetical protein